MLAAVAAGGLTETGPEEQQRIACAANAVANAFAELDSDNAILVVQWLIDAAEQALRGE